MVVSVGYEYGSVRRLFRSGVFRRIIIFLDLVAYFSVAPLHGSTGD